MLGPVSTHLRNNVVGYVAVFIALGGTAAALPGANTVTSGDIVDAEVKSRDIRDGRVRAVDLGTNAVTTEKVAEDSLTGDDVDEASFEGLGTVTQVNTGAGLTGGPITSSGAVSLAPCPQGQVLKSSGSGNYACADDVDTDSDTTYTAGAGLQLSGTQFSIADNGVTSARVANGSLTAPDLGRVFEVTSTFGTFANGTCSGVGVAGTAGGGLPGDFTIVSSTPPQPPGVLLSGVVDTPASLYIRACNFTGTQVTLPEATYRMLMIRP